MTQAWTRMVSKGKMTQDNECQGQRQKTREADLRDTFELSFLFLLLFFKSKAFMWTGGKDSWCFIFFYVFYRVFRIWLAPAPSQLFTCGLWSLFLLSALWEKDVMFPCWENWSSERSAFTTSPDWCVTAEPQVKSQSCLAHVLSTTSSCLPCHYNGKLLASVKTSVPLVTKEKRQGN